MPRDYDLQEINEFSGGLPGLADDLNQIVKVVNALVRATEPTATGSSSSGTTVDALWTLFGDDGSVRLQRVRASNITLAEEITSDTQIP
jgi:hypothetical protein